MAANPWNAFKKQHVYPENLDGDRKSHPPPKRPQVRRWERAHGLVLPDRYVDFVCLLGPGDFIGTGFTVFSPCWAEVNPLMDLAAMNSEFHQYQPEQFVERDPESVVSMFAFAKTFGGDYVGWDPRKVISTSPREYPILMHFHSNCDTEVVAASFEEFVTDWCIGNKFIPFDPENMEETLEQFQEFRPHPYFAT